MRFSKNQEFKLNKIGNRQQLFIKEGRGMKEQEMEKIAELFKRLLIDRESPTALKNEVEGLSRSFIGLEYCF